MWLTILLHDSHFVIFFTFISISHSIPFCFFSLCVIISHFFSPNICCQFSYNYLSYESALGYIRWKKHSERRVEKRKNETEEKNIHSIMSIFDVVMMIHTKVSEHVHFVSNPEILTRLHRSAQHTNRPNLPQPLDNYTDYMHCSGLYLNNDPDSVPLRSTE